MQRYLNLVIEKRQQNGVKRGEDILSLLCSATYEDGQPITREHIHAELLTFLFAGHETTALTLTWAMYHLHSNPDAYASLIKELDSLEDNSPATLTSAPYLKATVQETLRVHPIVTETLRKLNATNEAWRVFITRRHGCGSGKPFWLTTTQKPTRNRKSFSPERFMERSYSPFQYMPFGGGHRRCIGAAFASFEIAIVLGTLLKRFQFELIDSALGCTQAKERNHRPFNRNPAPLHRATLIQKVFQAARATRIINAPHRTSLPTRRSKDSGRPLQLPLVESPPVPIAANSSLE